MIYKGSNEITAISRGSQPLAAIYRGTRLIWQAVRSCFGSGKWVPAKPWLGNETWKY